MKEIPDFLMNKNVIRCLPNIALNTWRTLWKMRPAGVPAYLTWQLTYDCNCRCPKCSFPEKHGLRPELTEEECLAFARQIKGLPIMLITMTGGEVLTRPDLFDILHEMGEGKIINVVTNGLLLRENGEKILQSPISNVTVSIDSHRENVNDVLRGKAGVFRNAIEGIEYIRKNRKGKTPRILLRCVLTRHNIDTIDDYIGFFKDKVDHIGFQPIENNFEHQIHDQGILFAKDEYEAFSVKMNKLIEKYPFLNTDYYRHLADFIFKPDTLWERKIFRCFFTPAFLLYIEPWGDAHACRKYCEVQGLPNVRSQSIGEIWRSPQHYQQQLDMRNNKCLCYSYTMNGTIFFSKYLRPFI